MDFDEIKGPLGRRLIKFKFYMESNPQTVSLTKDEREGMIRECNRRFRSKKDVYTYMNNRLVSKHSRQPNNSSSVPLVPAPSRYQLLHDPVPATDPEGGEERAHAERGKDDTRAHPPRDQRQEDVQNGHGRHRGLSHLHPR